MSQPTLVEFFSDFDIRPRQRDTVVEYVSAFFVGHAIRRLECCWDYISFDETQSERSQNAVLLNDESNLKHVV